MMKENVLNFRDRTPIFPGKTCYPLSDNCSSHTEEFDQLSVILDVIGTPSEEETLCFKNSRLKAFLNSRKKKSGQVSQLPLHYFCLTIRIVIYTSEISGYLSWVE